MHSSSHMLSLRSYASASLSVSAAQLEDGRTDTAGNVSQTFGRQNAETLAFHELLGAIEVCRADVLLVVGAL
jgi:hypothetical protein